MLAAFTEKRRIRRTKLRFRWHFFYGKNFVNANIAYTVQAAAFCRGTSTPHHCTFFAHVCCAGACVAYVCVCVCGNVSVWMILPSFRSASLFPQNSKVCSFFAHPQCERHHDTTSTNCPAFALRACVFSVRSMCVWAGCCVNTECLARATCDTFA